VGKIGGMVTARKVVSIMDWRSAGSFERGHTILYYCTQDCPSEADISFDTMYWTYAEPDKE
jgi:hypothetical protein